MTANRPLPSWVWLLVAGGLLVLAAVWWSRGEDAPEDNAGPSLQNTGRRPAPPGGDFSSTRPDRPIERRERPVPSTFQGQGVPAPRAPERAAPPAP